MDHGPHTRGLRYARSLADSCVAPCMAGCKNGAFTVGIYVRGINDCKLFTSFVTVHNPK